MTDTSSFVQLVSYSGCGNTVNANHPVATQLILDSLRHWVQEYHVDGFRFDLASCLCGAADLYQNNNRKPYHSINFVVVHDGFTLHDLVAYNKKHNEANGEGNNDGSNDNFSWNCGAEGETEDEGVRRLRAKEMRNMIVVLMLSQGTPMILCGDEYGHTCYGNNNWYGHNSEMTWFQWGKLQHGEGNDLFRFTSEMIKFRKQHPSLGRAEFVGNGDTTWLEDQWDSDDSRFLALALHDREGEADLCCALNAHGFAIDSHLLPAPGGKRRCRSMDTNLPSPKDFVQEQTYRVESYSRVVLTGSGVAVHLKTQAFDVGAPLRSALPKSCIVRCPERLGRRGRQPSGRSKLLARERLGCFP